MEKVYVKKLAAPHQSESFTEYLPLNDALKADIAAAVKEIFDAAGGASMLKSSKDVYIKPNGIDAKAYCYTRTEVVEAVISYWFSAGAKHVYLFENSTQSNFTRMVFYINGYTEVCKRTGAIPIYLDEQKNTVLSFKGKPSEKENPDGYMKTSFEFPVIVQEKLIDRGDENPYISLPKLKTHSMSLVTLGVKNQWAFPRQRDRGYDHNWNLHHKLTDVLSYIRPDFTLIEGIEGTTYGHYPMLSHADKCIVPFKLLIGSKNVVAADIVGARIFGLNAEEVPHLKIAIDRDLSQGVTGLADIEIEGNVNLDDYTTTYPTDLYDAFPDDVNIIRGTERLCREGCRNNPLTLLQIIHNDFGGTGGWDMVIGKGHDPEVIDNLKGPVLIAGHCAVDEVSERLIKRLGKKNVYISGKCNDLTATGAAMFHLMHVDPMEFAPIPLYKSVTLLLQAKLHGTKAVVPSFLAHKIKTV